MASLVANVIDVADYSWPYPLVRILYEYLVFLSKVPAKRTYSTYYPRYHNSTPTLLLSTTTNSTKLYQALPKQTQRKLLIGPSIHQQCYP